MNLAQAPREAHVAGYIELALVGAFLLMSMCAVASRWISPLTQLSDHGRHRSTTDREPQFLGGWTVPKAWFAHFYAVGLAWNTALLAQLALQACRDSPCSIG